VVLSQHINEMMRWAAGTPLKLFEEVKPGTVKLMRSNATHSRRVIRTGDIICFQVEMSDEETHNLEMRGKCSDPIQFFKFLRDQVLIKFQPKSGKADDMNPAFDLSFNKNLHYDDMATKVAEYLNHDPKKLRFTTTHLANGQANAVIKASRNERIQHIVTSAVTTQEPVLILYERRNPKWGLVKATLTGGANQERSKRPFLPPEATTVHDLAKALLELNGTDNIGVFKASKDEKTHKRFVGSEMIGNAMRKTRIHLKRLICIDVSALDVCEKQV